MRKLIFVSMVPFQSSNPDSDVLEAEDVDVLELLEFERQLIIYNDDVNTFDWVIECLMDILHHTSEQAEQNAMLIHFKGKACVKEDSLEVLRPLKDALCERGLSAVIEGAHA